MTAYLMCEGWTFFSNESSLVEKYNGRYASLDCSG
jgi:hypothetical protein